MTNLQQRIKRKSNLTVLCFVLLTFNLSSYSQKAFKINGIWEITNMVFISPPNGDEMNNIWNSCHKRRIQITDSRFIFSSTKCFLYKTASDFKIVKRFVIKYEDAVNNDIYPPKAIDFLFDKGKRKSISGVRTNYTFKSFDGDVPDLEVFYLDKTHLILFQGENIVFVKKIK